MERTVFFGRWTLLGPVIGLWHKQVQSTGFTHILPLRACNQPFLSLSWLKHSVAPDTEAQDFKELILFSVF